MQNDIVVTQLMVDAIKRPFATGFTVGSFDWHAYVLDNERESEGVYSFGMACKPEGVIDGIYTKVSSLLEFDIVNEIDELKGWVPILYLVVDHTHNDNNEMVIYHDSLRPDVRKPLAFVRPDSSNRVCFKDSISDDIKLSIARDIIDIMQQEDNKSEFLRGVEACRVHIGKLADDIDF